jgi:sterol desaturase/sphingolipid hydroxylase (fatty acid hydroxylase superfamily)
LELLRGFASTTLLTVLALLAMIVMEHVGPRERYSVRERLPGVLINTVGTFLSLIAAWPLYWLWSRLGIPPLLSVPLWRWLEPFGAIGYTVQVLALVAIADFLIYWRHRAEHAWFWPIHVVHHSPHELHAANDIAHPLQILPNFLLVSLPLSLVQIDGPEAPVAVGLIIGFANMYIHSPVEWHFGPLRKLIVDNRFHRIHHSREERHFDKNFGICFSLWDYLFGTAYDPKEEWPAVGVEDVPPPRTVAQYLLLPFARRQTPVETPSSAVPNFAD